MKRFIKKYGSLKAGAVLLVPVMLILLTITGCPNPVVEADLSAAPAAFVSTGVHAGEEGAEVDQKAVVFTLTSSHPVDAIWKVYNAETGGEALTKVSATYDPATKKLTLTALENNLVMDGDYWVSVTERGRDESPRLKLQVKFLYPLTITYDANGGAFSDQTTEFSGSWNGPGSTKPYPGTNPSRTGFSFAGWNENSDGSGGVFTVAAILTGDVYVFAKWIAEATPYTVTFDANGGTFSNGDSSLDKTGTFTGGGTGTTLGVNMPEEPTHTVYGFDSWNTRPDGLGTAFDGNTVIYDPAITVYAKWRWNKNSASLKLYHDFDPARYTGGVFAPATGDSATTKAAPKNTGWTRGSGTYGAKTFYYFKTGERRAMNNSAAYLDLGTGAGTILKSAANGYTIAAYIHIEGDRSGNGSFIWTFAGGNNNPSEGVFFIANSGRIDHVTKQSSERTFALPAADRGKIANGTWLHVAYTQKGTDTDNARLYINGELALAGSMAVLPAGFSSTLIFNTLGGPCFTADYNLSQTMFTDFRIYDEALEAIQIAALAEDLNDLKAVANWAVPATYTLSFDSNSEGSVTNPTDLSVLSGDVVSLPVVMRAGYDFDGWYTEAIGGERFTATTPVTASRTLYAHWAAKVVTVVGASGTTVNNSAANLVDDDLSTLWTTNRLNQFYLMDLSFRKDDGSIIDAGDPAGLSGYRHWITIDLGQAVDNISKLEYYPREGGNVNQLVKNCEIYTSEEVNLKINIQRAITANLAKKVGETPAGGWDVTSSTGWRPAITFTSDGTADGTAAPVRARYIQMRVTGTSQGTTGTYQMAVGELRLYTKTGETETVLTYPAGTQAYGDSHNSDQRGMLPMQAIDGSTSTNWLSGNIDVRSYFNSTDFAALKANLPADPHFDVGHWITLDLGATPEAYTGLKYHRRRDNNNLGNFSGVEIYASNTLIDPAGASNAGMVLVKTFTGLPIGTLNNIERWTLLNFGQSINRRYLHIRITGEIYAANAGYGNDYNAGPNTGGEVQANNSQLGDRWGSAAAAEFTIVKE
jgi:uncharacterized repeat protein (TIGR02543 family)